MKPRPGIEVVKGDGGRIRIVPDCNENREHNIDPSIFYEDYNCVVSRLNGGRLILLRYSYVESTNEYVNLVQSLKNKTIYKILVLYD